MAIKKFENNVVLTSQHPEAFLSITYEDTSAGADPSTLILTGSDLLTGWTIDFSAGYQPAASIFTGGNIDEFANDGISTQARNNYAYSNSFTGNTGDTFFLSLLDPSIDDNYGVSEPKDGHLDWFICNDACLYYTPAGAAFDTAGNWGWPWTSASNSLRVNKGYGNTGETPVDYPNKIFTTTADGPYRLVARLSNSNNPIDSVFVSYHSPYILNPGNGRSDLYRVSTSGYVDISAGGTSGDLYINGWDISKQDASNFSLNISSTNTIAPFSIRSASIGDFEYNVQVSTYLGDGSVNQTFDVSIFNRPFLASSEINNYPTATPLVENESSYLLLRTNPKYSGNVKLMVDSSDNMFLDTFKVSEILSNKKYRRQRVSGSSFLSGDISRVFKTLPQGEMYKVSRENTLNISQPKTEYSDQYNTTYNYGAKILIDDLYDEKYSILAPLWINTKLPEYFAVFRFPGTYNEESYEVGGDIDGLAKKFVTDSELVKSWNMKIQSPLGNYLNKHLSELLKYESPISLSLNEYDANTWNGINVNKGVISPGNEVPYFFQQDASDLTRINAFVSQGFERQNLLCPNLVNLEYAFNDDVSDYSMNRYFGLYLTENELYQIAYHKDEYDASVNIISLDGKDVSVFIDSSVFDTNGDVATDYTNRIFVINNGTNLERIHNSYQINTDPSTTEDYANRLGDNIFNTEVTKKDINAFITFKINEILFQGEHLRVINKSDHKIWEVYGTDTDVLNAGESGPYISTVDPSPGYPRVYRTSFSVKGEINDQINAIENAFKLFNEFEDKFSIGFNKGNALSILVDGETSDQYSFQRLTAQVTDSFGSHDSSFNSAASYGDISFYNTFTPDASDFVRFYYDASFGPIDFEIFGDRMGVEVNMYNPVDSNHFCYSFDSSTTELFTDHVMYEAIDGLNRRIKLFDISTNFDRSSFWIEDPTSSNNDALIITNKAIDLEEDNIWWGYDVFKLLISIMGIDCVKDFDYTVYDNSTGSMNFDSNYRYSRGDDASMYEMSINFGDTKVISERNSYEILSGAGTILIDGSTLNYTASSNTNFNTFFGSATITPSDTTRITYNSINGSQTFTSYDSGISEEDINDYYADLYFDASENYKTKKDLKYSLTIPTITKWGSVGKDLRNNDVRLNLTTKLFANPSTGTHSNFVPITDSSLYSNELSYPTFKYLSPGETFGGDYVYYDVNDLAVDSSGNRTTIRDLMFNNPTIDIFSKMIYNTKNTSGKRTRSSLGFYNLYKNTLKTIIKGLSLDLEITAEGAKQLDTRTWDRYRISFITSPSRILSNIPMEVIINENTETILIIWYQGNDVLHYNKRKSDYLASQNILIDSDGNGGKSFTNLTIDASYTHIKTPFIVDTASYLRYTVNLYDNSTYYDNRISNKLSQFNYNVNGLNSVFNAYGTNSVDASIFTFASSFDTFTQGDDTSANIINYSFTRNVISYANDVINITSSYENNDNYYKDITNNIDKFKSIIDANNVTYSIFRGDSILTSDDFSSAPVKIILTNPTAYKAPNWDTSIYTYNGSYKPIFRNILNFDDNESDLTNIVEKDFIFANTDLTSYNKIYQYWYNRVVGTVTAADSSDNIKYATNYNPFSSQWDNDYYTLSTGSLDTKVDGFKSGIEKPAFFGSKLVALPDTIVLDTWNSVNTKISIFTGFRVLEYNITQAIIDKFTNTLDFVDNWGGISGVGDDDIGRYINKTVISYYNISKDKLDVEVWNKPIFNTYLAYEWDDDFKEQKKVKNMRSWMSYEKGEYIYKIQMGIGTRETWFTKITFNRK